MSSDILRVGKLPMDFLHSLLERFGGQDDRLIVGPRVGEDAAVLDMGDRYLVVKSDPITFATDDIGWYVVHINANDLAMMGATPRWLLVTLLLPEGRADRSLVETIFSQTSEACRTLGITLVGGHTEITHGLDRPIAVGVLLGEVDKKDLVCSANVQSGDHLILSKGIAIEGTAVLAQEMGARLTALVGEDLVARGLCFLKEPGISILRDVQIMSQVGTPHAMHDPTEGGLATGLWELAWASDKRLVIDPTEVLVFPETQAFCDALNLDPLGLLASGALLAAVPPELSAPMIRALALHGIPARVIGWAEDGPAAVVIKTATGLEPLTTFERDELAQLFERQG